MRWGGYTSAGDFATPYPQGGYASGVRGVRVRNRRGLAQFDGGRHVPGSVARRSTFTKVASDKSGFYSLIRVGDAMAIPLPPKLSPRQPRTARG